MNDNTRPTLTRAAKCYRLTWHAPNGLEGKTFARGLIRAQKLISLYQKLGYRFTAEIV